MPSSKCGNSWATPESRRWAVNVWRVFQPASDNANYHLISFSHENIGWHCGIWQKSILWVECATILFLLSGLWCSFNVKMLWGSETCHCRGIFSGSLQLVSLVWILQGGAATDELLLVQVSRNPSSFKSTNICRPIENAVKSSCVWWTS